MELSVFLDVCVGWCVWSLGHNLGHRWWHIEMLGSATSFYAHGEREHHRIYDPHGQKAYQLNEDPKESFISFPLFIIAPVALLLICLYGWLRGWPHVWPFGGGLYVSMILDHQLHMLFHKRAHLNGVLGWFQRMHLMHHATHNRNYFFVSGLIWDVLFGTAVMRFQRHTVPEAPGVTPLPSRH